MVTIKDIADALGVAPSTVMRALADSSRINPKTKKWVQQMAEEMGHVANAAAKLMRGHDSTLIGLLIPDIENSFYAQVTKSVSDVCNASGFQLALALSDDNPTFEERHIRELVAARSAGIVIVPTANLTEKSAALLATKNVAQLIRKNPTLEANWYGIDDFDAIRTATQYLLDLRHPRIGLICGEDALSSGRERHEGYVVALREQGLELDSELIMRGPPNANFAKGAANQLSALPHPPSAIIAAGAGLSEGLLNAAARWKPCGEEGISLIGYSECNAFRWWRGTGLITIDLPVRQITTDLCSALLEHIEAKSLQTDPVKNHIYSSHLLLRGSVTPFAEG